ANTQYRIEFYNNPLGTEDATGYGEAKVLLGYIDVTTDGAGHASIDTTLSGVSVANADRISATATEIVNAGQIGIDDAAAFGSTSEMSQNLISTTPNTAPTITSSATVSADENQSAVFTVTATDADLDTLTYSISGGADAAKFAINSSTGELTFITAPDFESPTDVGSNNVYDVTVHVSDGNGGTDSQAISVTVTDGPDPVVANDDAVSTSEDTPMVISPLVNDSGPATIIEFTQPTNGSVTDNGNGTLTYTPDLNYTGADSFSYVVAGTDASLSHYWNLDGTANDSVGSSNGILNGTTTVAGSIGNGLSFNESSDYALLPDVTYGTEFTISFDFKLDDNSGSLFQYLYSHGDVNSTNSVNIFVNEASHGTDPNVMRTVIRDANDTLDNLALQFDIASIVGDGQWHTYTATVGPDGIEVFLDGVSQATDATRGTGGVNPTGSLYLGARQDLAADRYYGGALDSLRVYDSALTGSQVSALANTSSGTVNITVNAVNDDPVITSNGGAATAAVNVVENTTVVTTVSSTDVDGGTAVYSISGGADAAKFAINSSTGELTFIAAPDFESPTDVGGDNVYDVQVQVSDGNGGFDSQSISLTVLDQGVSQSIPIGQSINEDETLVFNPANGNAITVSDGTASDGRIQVTLSVPNGTLRLNNFGGYVWVQGSNGASLMTLEGTEAAINAALEDLTYIPNTDYNGSDTLTITTALNADLEGFYTFEGGNADDQSASVANDGLLLGNATTTIDAERGEVLNLDGTAGTTVQIAGHYGDPANVTVAAWVNVSGATGEVISLGNSFGIRVDQTNLSKGVNAFVYNGTSWDTADSGQFIQGTGWHHVAATYDGATKTTTLYIDGIEVGNVVSGSALTYIGTNPDTFIGKHGETSSTAAAFNGLIDDARVYNRALSADEIAAIAADEFVATDTVNITINAINDAPYFSDKTNANTEQISLADVKAVTSADLDNDGDADLIGTTDTGSLYWYENDGTGSFGSGTLIASAQNFRAVEVYDLEGDGDMDIVAMNDDPADFANSVFVLTNNFIGSGTVSFNTTSFEGSVGGESDGGQKLAIGDIDGNGLADIVGTFYRSIGDSQVVVFEQNSVGVWTKTFSDSVSNAYGIDLADMDG
ncbi:MAG: cadherin domain-containing protein, partial [Planctomycetales bacterium]|nr:cadherin domain-containing protein [Planctomycetales bacterium]